jgi:hypothetical protein
MSAIKLDDTFTITFYPDSTLKPDIRCFPDGDGAYEYTNITYEQAKQLVEGLQNFIQTVDKKKQQQEANDQIAMSAGYL